MVGLGSFYSALDGCIKKADIQRAISSVRSRPSVILGLMQVFGYHGREFLRRTYFFIQYKEIHNNR